MTTYVVGDIQGCYQGLRMLLDMVDFQPGKDTLWAAGDLIARGPDSQKTLEYLYSLGDSFHAVLGNHDLHFLAICCGFKAAKTADKLTPLLTDSKLSRYVDWLRQMPLAAKIANDTVLIHAGLYPKWGINKAIKLSGEIQQQLSGANWKTLLRHMYGSAPVSWHKELEGVQRQRFIINAMTRMRYLGPDLTLEFAYKCPPKQAPQHISPWFELPNKKLKQQQQVIFGHWAALMGVTHSSQYIGLDTGYVWGNTLTAIRLADNCLFSVQSPTAKKSN